MATPATASARIAKAWSTWSTRPGGRWIFNRMLALMVPYTGTISPRVEELRPGYARVRMRDRRRVRNHLRSIHAIALANLGELAGGLAVNLTIPPTVRAIPVRISIEYLKKARGTLTGECRVDIPEVTGDTELDVVTEIRNPAHELVARAVVRWRLGPA